MKRSYYVEREEREFCRIVRLMEQIDDGFGDVWSHERIAFMIDKVDGSVCRQRYGGRLMCDYKKIGVVA